MFRIFREYKEYLKFNVRKNLLKIGLKICIDVLVNKVYIW